MSRQQYDQSYEFMSARQRATTPLTTYRGWYANKRAFSFRQFIRSQVVSDSIVVLVALVTSTDVINGQVVTRDYFDAWTMVREGSAWRLDSVQTSQA